MVRFALHASLAIPVALWASSIAQALPPKAEFFGIADYFRLQRVNEVAISPAGDRLAYVVESPSLTQDVTVRSVFFQPLDAVGTAAKQLDGMDDAHALQWIGRTSELAFLSARAGSSQVYGVNVITHAVRQWTRASESVTSFLFSPAGDRLAYRTEKSSDITKSLTNPAETTSSKGILVDTNVLAPGAFPPKVPVHGRHLWVLSPYDGKPLQIQSIPGEVQTFFWSADGRLLSVAYIADNIPMFGRRDKYASIGIVDPHRDSWSVLFAGQPPGSTGAPEGVGYAGGEWAPDSTSVLVRRESIGHPWLREVFVDWTIASAEAAITGDARSWHPFEDNNSRYRVVDTHSFLAENQLGGVQSLFATNVRGTQPSNIVSSLKGSSSLFAFNEDLTRVAFVNESLTRPPEVYLWEKRGHRVRRVSNLNDEIAAKQMPRARKVFWQGKDGERVEGWILEPSSAATDLPRPLVTFVHGGPDAPVLDQFAYYFKVWPYPLAVLPAHGISVFIPCYRGTPGYGLKFSSPSALDAEPVDDIVTGIDYLISEGVADRVRLGIAGHSHGAWLAPVVMTRAKVFMAGAFAEGWSNVATLYDLMPDVLNREVHDVVNGGSLWDRPGRYLDMSPELHLNGIPTACLIEAGELSGDAPLMFPLAKAAKHFSLPTESVLYPRTDHNPTRPQIQRESAERNLDWFRFWLLGEKDTDPSKAQQYLRWERMAATWNAHRP